MSARGRMIAVTGSTGFVGRHVVGTMLAAGYRVRCLIRSREKAERVLPAPSEGGADSASIAWVRGSIEEPESFDELVEGCEAIVHAIGIRRELPPDVTFRTHHPDATRLVIEAARRAGIRRLVHISALGTRPEASTVYHQSKYASEMLVRESGLEWTILRPSMIHGPDGELMQMIKGWVRGSAAPWVFIPYFARASRRGEGGGLFPRPMSAAVQPVHVGDVALAVVRSIERRETIGEVYPLGGAQVLDWRGLLREVRDTLSPRRRRRKPIVAVPGSLASLNARVAQRVGLEGLLPFGPSEPIMALEDSVCSMAKAHAHLGLEPSDFSQTMRGYADRI